MFIASGLVLILLMIMAIVSKRKGWSLFNIFRTALVFSIGVGLSLVSLVSLNTALTANFLQTPWPLPTITICFFIVLIITHLPHPPRIFFKRSDFQDVELGKLPLEQNRERERDEPSENPKNYIQVDQQAYDIGATDRQTLGVESLHAQLPGHYDVGRRDYQASGSNNVRRSMTLRRGLTTIQRAAKSIHFEAGAFDPIAEGDLFFQGGSNPVKSSNLYSV